MHTKDTAETTAPSVRPSNAAPKPKPAGESEPEDPVPSMPLDALENDSLGSLGDAFSGLHVRTPEGKGQEKEKGKGGAEDDPEGEHARAEDVSSGKRPSERAPGATGRPAASSPTAATLRATHPAALSPTTTPPMAEGTGFTGMPYPTHALEPLGPEPPMAHPIIQPAACGSSYVAIHEPTTCHESDAFFGAPVGMCPATMPAQTIPEHSSIFGSGLRAPESCGGRSRGSGISSNKSLTRSPER